MTEIKFAPTGLVAKEVNSAWVIRSPHGLWADRCRPKGWTDSITKRQLYKSPEVARSAAVRAKLEYYCIIEVTMQDTHVYMESEASA